MTTASHTANSTLTLRLWRWHFYAGLFCIPFVLLLSLSGAVYLFKPQYIAWQDQPFREVAGKGPQLSPSKLIEKAMASLPNPSFSQYRLPQTDTEAVKISLHSQGERYWVWINPSNGEILKSQLQRTDFMQWVRDLHGELLLGDFGTLWVELAASWTIVLVITGVYLHWPKRGFRWLGFLVPRPKRGRAGFKQWHAVIGLWMSFFILFLLVSGLPWTSVWGAGFKSVRSQIEQLGEQSWQTSSKATQRSWMSQAVSKAQLPPAVINQAVAAQLAPPVMLSVANEETQQWKVASLSQNRPLREMLWINADGSIAKRSGFADKKPIDKAIGIGIAVHEGQLFGWFNQLLGLLTALGLTALSVTGAVMWWKRKPAGQLGAPKATNAPIPKPLLAITLCLLMFLPMLLISSTIILVIERVFTRSQSLVQRRRLIS